MVFNYAPLLKSSTSGNGREHHGTAGSLDNIPSSRILCLGVILVTPMVLLWSTSKARVTNRGYADIFADCQRLWFVSLVNVHQLRVL